MKGQLAFTDNIQGRKISKYRCKFGLGVNLTWGQIPL